MVGGDRLRVVRMVSDFVVSAEHVEEHLSIVDMLDVFATVRIVVQHYERRVFEFFLREFRN